MIIGILNIELSIPESNSLKAKRQIIKSLKDKLRRSFNISISETDNHDIWQRCSIGISMVGAEKSFINSALDRILDFVDEIPSVELIDSQLEFL